MSDDIFPDDDPQFIEDDDLEPIPLESHPLFSHLPKKPEAQEDLDRFLKITRPPAEEGEAPAPPKPAPIFPRRSDVIPQPMENFPPVSPQGYTPKVEVDDLEIPGLPPEPPAPEIQSSFVNPALVRVVTARPKPAPRPPSEIWLGVRTIFLVVSVALVVAFIFSYWTPESFLSDDFVANLQVVSSTQGPPTPLPSPLPTFSSVQKVGIITGHSGPPLNPAFEVDPGAICDENFDGVPELTELEINTAVSFRVANRLVEAGYLVEMLDEWDARLDNYRADALISIHTNTCENLGFGATGFNMTAYERSPMIDRDNVLVDCLVAAYSSYTSLERHFGSPPDLVDYHAFRQVSVDTPTVIIELGFMFSDRQVLTQRPDDMAQGIFEGVDCFLKGQTAFN